MVTGILSIFGGAFVGMVVGWLATSCVLLMMGMGHSHDDMFTVAAGTILGAPIGAVVLPSAMWWRTRRRRRHSRGPAGS